MVSHAIMKPIMTLIFFIGVHIRIVNNNPSHLEMLPRIKNIVHFLCSKFFYDQVLKNVHSIDSNL
jgi:hypothetical protein